jgi:hypothetical protein
MICDTSSVAIEERLPGLVNLGILLFDMASNKKPAEKNGIHMSVSRSFAPSFQ